MLCVLCAMDGIRTVCCKKKKDKISYQLCMYIIYN